MGILVYTCIVTIHVTVTYNMPAPVNVWISITIKTVTNKVMSVKFENDFNFTKLSGHSYDFESSRVWISKCLF